MNPRFALESLFMTALPTGGEWARGVMNEKLRDLIGQATSRIEARNAAREADRIRAHQLEQEQDAENFRRKVHSTLGDEVLDAVGPVAFHEDFLNQSMTFIQDSRTFRLQQQTGFLVQLEDEAGNWLGHQFNLENPDAKDTFLHTLGTALRRPSGESDKEVHVSTSCPACGGTLSKTSDTEAVCFVCERKYVLKPEGKRQR